MTQLLGFQVRRLLPEEVCAVAQWFGNSALDPTQSELVLAALGQPADVPLGAILARPVKPGIASQRAGRFQIFVAPEYRRRRIGTTLVRHLYDFALANKVERLILSQLIHQDRLAENAFCRSVGMSPERAFATYSVRTDVAASLLDPVVERFRSRHRQLAGAAVVPLTHVELQAVAHFLAAQYGMYEAVQLQRLNDGTYDLRLSCALVRDGQIRAAALVRARADQPYVMIELIVADPEHRHGPVAAALCAHATHAAMALGFTGGVFEADEQFDSFATNLAKRCGAAPQWHRYRYAIDRAGMTRCLDDASSGTAQRS